MNLFLKTIYFLLTIRYILQLLHLILPLNIYLSLYRKLHNIIIYCVYGIPNIVMFSKIPIQKYKFNYRKNLRDIINYRRYELLYYDSYCNYIIQDIILIDCRSQILYIDNNKLLSTLKDNINNIFTNVTLNALSLEILIILVELTRAKFIVQDPFFDYPNNNHKTDDKIKMFKYLLYRLTKLHSKY
ncbi:hypothetical protein AGLY_005850 [Aphis glycines]|uniref:Uncharacterized protein n=1 Tax=Aphis glycines TaxID=307491 RepID=A0A6G0TS31_APHGL|nr:hypothetical protein AGLY_005850 [Aphis glycines]